MKKLTMVMAMSFCLLTAGFAVALDDVVVDSRNTNTNNINTAGGTSNQTQDQNQDQRQNQTTITRGNLLEVGFVGFLTPGTPIVGTEWKFFYSRIYSKLTVKQVSKGRYGFSWGGIVNFTAMGDSLPENRDDIYLMNYWPEVAMNQGDEILGFANVKGKPDWDDFTFLAEGANACKIETGSRRIAVLSSTLIDGITTGMSLGGSGAVSELSSAGTTGVAFAAGGLIGKNRTHADRITNMRIACMNDGPLYLMGEGPSEMPPVVSVVPTSPPQPSNGCDPSQILLRIKELEREVQKCTQYCFNNLTLRQALGDANVELYSCTGNRKYLEVAVYHYQVAERNSLNGHDISAHSGEARQIMAQVYFNWAGAIREIQGRDAALAFAKAKHLERIPTGFAR